MYVTLRGTSELKLVPLTQKYLEDGSISVGIYHLPRVRFTWRDTWTSVARWKSCRGDGGGGGRVDGGMEEVLNANRVQTELPCLLATFQEVLRNPKGLNKVNSS